MDKTVKQATFRSVVSSGRLKGTKTEIFRDNGGSDDRITLHLLKVSLTIAVISFPNKLHLSS